MLSIEQQLYYIPFFPSVTPTTGLPGLNILPSVRTCQPSSQGTCRVVGGEDGKVQCTALAVVPVVQW